MLKYTPVALGSRQFEDTSSATAHALFFHDVTAVHV